MRSALISVARGLTQLRKSERANVATMVALLAPVLVGGLGLGAETANWYFTERAMQNAADEAAIAAASNGSPTSYNGEALAVSANYGFQNGTNHVTVSATNAAACPAGGNNCYRVTVTAKVPLYLAQVIGYSGNTTINGNGAELLSATAIATAGTTPRQYCLLALNSLGSSIIGNGVPNTNFAGCNTMSNSSAICHGHDMGADFGDAHITDSGCGVIQESNIPTVPDPYAGYATNIPPNPCGGNNPQEPARRSDPPLPSSNQWGTDQNLNGNVIVCGDLQLTDDVTINAPNGATLVIENGQLDTNGHTIRTANGSTLTVVFSGDNGGGYTHGPTGGGTLDIQAPKSGPWSGVAMYQDPSLTTGVDQYDAGNSPTWDITGLVYMPHANVTFKGAVNKSSNGDSCFALVVGDIVVDGTGAILAHGGCDAAGLPMPTGQVPGRGILVF
jgi:Flp pilus assembly protein TadG